VAKKAKIDPNKKWLEPPLITALSDAPVKKNTFKEDAFELGRTMGPVYDILRHPKTQTPLSIGIYGTWGSGKSTAMHWLEDRLDLWTTDAIENKKEDRVKVYSTWFYPWKYDKKEDVWRGLIAEVLLACMKQVEDTGSGTCAKLAKDCGKFLGKSFVHLLSSAKLGDMAKIVDEAAEFLNPSKAYLNAFETVLENAVRDTLGNKEGEAPQRRLVVFIDDLDRCLPDVALQVLEALKLYLNIPDLVFVLGVDHDVINELVVGHYEKLGLSPDKSRQYLAKMFQVEIPIAPLEQKLDAFLLKQIKDNESWDALKLNKKEAEIFQSVILKISNGVPRDIKRLVNYCLMAGRGVTFTDDKDDITAGEAIQFSLLYKALDTHGKRNMITSKAGQQLFFDISHKVESKDTETFNSTHTADMEKMVGGKTEDIIKDPIIRELLTLPFPEPKRLGTLARSFKTTAPHDGEPELIRILEKELNGKKWADANEDDLKSITKLDLSFNDIHDLAPLKGLTQLQTLSLSNTKVAEVAPLEGLTQLYWLDLSDTQVADLSPLKGLGTLTELHLNDTPKTQKQAVDLKRANPKLTVHFEEN